MHCAQNSFRTIPKVGRYLRELGMPPLGLQEEGLTKGATTPPMALWNALYKAAPTCDLGHYSMGFELTDSLTLCALCQGLLSRRIALHTICTIEWASS